MRKNIKKHAHAQSQFTFCFCLHLFFFYFSAGSQTTAYFYEPCLHYFDFLLFHAKKLTQTPIHPYTHTHTPSSVQANIFIHFFYLGAKKLPTYFYDTTSRSRTLYNFLGVMTSCKKTRTHTRAHTDTVFYLHKLKQRIGLHNSRQLKFFACPRRWS